MLKYVQVAKTSFLRASYYRFELLFDSLKAFVTVALIVAVWNEIYGQRDTIGGFDRRSAILYTVSAVTLTLVFEVNLERTLGDKFRKGTLALDLLRPYDFFLFTFAEHAGVLLYSVVFSGVPTAVALVLVLGASPPAEGWLAAAPLAVVGFLLFYVFCHICALTTFVTEEVWGVSYLRTTVVRFLAGGFIPLSFFPAPLARASELLPFQYMVYVPASALAGRIGVSAVPGVLVPAAAWIVGLLAIDRLYWRFLVRRITHHGG